jgi:SM-20-related protein
MTVTMEKMEALLKRLKFIKEASHMGLWLTTDEVGELLDLPPDRLQELRHKPLTYEFLWRNFRIYVAGEQDRVKFWRISDRPTEIKLATPVADQIIPAIFARIDNFFTKDILKKLLQFVLNAEPKFTNSTNSDNNPDYRRSLVLYHQDFMEFYELMLKQVTALVPQVVKSLKMLPFDIDDIECQLTAHNDGNFYKVHNDNGSPEVASRELTYVYYFFQEPKRFEGGELRIYDSKVENNMYVKMDTYKTFVPTNNTIIFFPSHYMHEVLLVSCPSRKFADSRFTINGWVRRKM